MKEAERLAIAEHLKEAMKKRRLDNLRAAVKDVRQNVLSGEYDV